MILLGARVRLLPTTPSAGSSGSRGADQTGPTAATDDPAPKNTRRKYNLSAIIVHAPRESDVHNLPISRMFARRSWYK